MIFCKQIKLIEQPTRETCEMSRKPHIFSVLTAYTCICYCCCRQFEAHSILSLTNIKTVKH